MPKPDFPYRKLPGARRGILSGASLWLGNDHILHVKNTRFAEDYRRYYFTDIEAIYLQKTARFLPPPGVIIALILGLIAILILSVSRKTFAVECCWIALLAVSCYAAFLCIFRSCVCSIQTALGTDRLSCLHRLSSSRAAIDQITNRVVQTQGEQEYIPLDVERQPEPIESPRTPSRERLFSWLTVPFVLLSATVILRLPMARPEQPFGAEKLFIAALWTILAVVTCAVVALIAGRGGRFRAVQGALLAIVALSGLELYTLVSMNTYAREQPLFGSGIRGSTMMADMARAAHFGSIGLAAGSIAVAFVFVLLLLRNPPRDQK